MNNIEKELNRERKIAHERRKILRIKPIIWICRYWYLTIIIIALIITTLLGVYNIDGIDFVNREGKNVKEREIRELIKRHMQKNFFTVNPEEVEEDVLKNSYIKSVEVEKIFPDKLKIKIEEYQPFIAFEEEDRCKIFSRERTLLEVKEEMDCKVFTEEEGIIYFIGETTLTVEENGKQYFYLANKISNISQVLDQFDISIKLIDMKSNVLNISTNAGLIIMDTNQDNDIELARLFLVLKELKEQGVKSSSIDVRFKRPIIQIDN